MGVFDRTCFQSQVGPMRGFVRRAAREMRGYRTVGDKGQLRGSEGQPVYAGLSEVRGSPGDAGAGMSRGKGCPGDAGAEMSVCRRLQQRPRGRKTAGPGFVYLVVMLFTTALWSSCCVRFLCCRRIGCWRLCRSLCDLFRRILHYGACSRFVC